jgi:MYXO-CTERM domain-containing protein
LLRAREDFTEKLEALFHAIEPEVVVAHFSSVPLLSLLDLTALMVGGEDAAPVAVMVSVDVGHETVVVAGVPAADEPPAAVLLLLLLALVQLRRRPPPLPFSRVGDFTSNTDVSLSMSDST